MRERKFGFVKFDVGIDGGGLDVNLLDTWIGEEAREERAFLHSSLGYKEITHWIA